MNVERSQGPFGSESAWSTHPACGKLYHQKSFRYQKTEGFPYLIRLIFLGWDFSPYQAEAAIQTDLSGGLMNPPMDSVKVEGLVVKRVKLVNPSSTGVFWEGYLGIYPMQFGFHNILAACVFLSSVLYRYRE